MIASRDFYTLVVTFNHCAHIPLHSGYTLLNDILEVGVFRHLWAWLDCGLPGVVVGTHEATCSVFCVQCTYRLAYRSSKYIVSPNR